MLKFIIIDNFNVKEEQGGMKPGLWFIANGDLPEEDKLPAIGSKATLKRPSGSTLEVTINGYDLRHAKKSVIGLQLAGLAAADVPRLSELSMTENG